MRKSLYGELADHADMAHVLNNIGATYANLNDKAKAIDYSEKAFEMQKRLFIIDNEEDDDDHPDIIETLENLSAAYSSLTPRTKANEEKSLAFASQAYEMQSRLFPNVDHPRTARLLLSMAQSNSNLAVDERENANLSKKYETRAMELKLDAYNMQCLLYNGRDHPDVATTLQSLGESSRKKRELNEALDYFMRAYEMRKVVYENKPHKHLLETLRSLDIVNFQMRPENDSCTFRETADEMQKQLEQESKHRKHSKK